MVAVLAVTALALPALFELRVDNALEVWLDRSSPSYQEYEEFLHTFGSEEFVLLIYELPVPLELSFLESLTDLRLDLEALPSVRETTCLSSLYSRFFGFRGLAAFADDIAKSPFYSDFLVSSDRRYGAVWVWLELERPDDRFALVSAVEEIAARSALGEISLAGSPVLNTALDRASQHSARTLFPWVFALSAALLWLLFRRFHGVAIPFLAVGTGIIWTLGLLSACGRSLNMVTVALPPLVWVLGLSTSIHLLIRCQQMLDQGLVLEEALSRTVRELARPCGYSALTTAFGFSSLLASSMQPVRELGLFAALGVIACLVANFLLFPVLARACLRRSPMSSRPPLSGPWTGRLFTWLATVVTRRAGAVLALAAMLVAGLVGGIWRLRAEASVIEFFKPEAPIRRIYEELLPRFTGAYSLEIVLTPESEDLDTYRRMAALADFVASLPGTARVLSSVDLLRKVRQETASLPPEDFGLPEDEAALASDLAELELRLGREQEMLKDPGSGSFRLSILVQALRSSDHRRLVETIDQHLATTVDPTWKPRLTGIVKLLVELQQQLLTSQIRTFALAFLLIGPALAFLLRSPRDALLSLLPNLFPIAFALGVMGYGGIPLDPATVMIAGVALGIAVDNTIHFLVHYRLSRRAGMDPDAAVRETLQAIGRALALTTLVASLGFGVLVLADFVPLVYFGGLTAATMVAALVGDLFILPAILLVCERRADGEPPRRARK